MKILHTSDWHLGISLHNFSLLEDQQFFINQLADIIESQNIDAVVLAGDVFDSSVSSAQAIEAYNSAVTAICLQKKTPLLIIAGNHDGAARLSCARELLKGAGLYIEGRVKKTTEPVIIKDTAFYLIPYFNTDEVRALFPEIEIKSTEQAMKLLCSEIRKNMDKSLTNIVVAHAFVSGAALSDSDTSAVIGTASMISADVFEGFDYAALGHLHRVQSIKNAHYSGSPLKYSALEAELVKSVNIFDTACKKVQSIELCFLRNLRVITGSYEELLKSACCSEDYIKLEITDKFISHDMLAVFRSFYPHLFAASGKNSVEGEEIIFSAEEVKSMSGKQLLTHFCDEILQCTPTDKQIQMFEEAMLMAGEEDKGE